jgi:signal transduction histidine kinase
MLGTILTNLFSNAVAYTPPGGEIRLAIEEDAQKVSLKVSNSTDNLTQEDLDHLFETFWRRDSALEDSDHSGIGLSLVDALAGVNQARKSFYYN